MTSPTVTVDDWARLYCDALPPHLRPRLSDERFQIAADGAQRHGWAPRAAAAAVAGIRNYEGARNPVYLALMRLEDIAGREPGNRAPRRGVPEPHGCAVGWIDHPSGATTEPCPTCRPQLAARLAMIPPPGQRSDADYAYLRYREEV
jgi:hypothetical protein